MKKNNLLRVSIQGFNKDDVRVNADFVGTGNSFEFEPDGYKLTQFNLQIQVFNPEQIERVIKLLEITKRCFVEYGPPKS